MKFNLKKRPKIPSFYHEVSEKKTHDKMFKDLCACYEWFEGFEKELRELFNTERKNNADAYPHTFAVVVFLEQEILGE